MGIVFPISEAIRICWLRIRWWAGARCRKHESVCESIWAAAQWAWRSLLERDLNCFMKYGYPVKAESDQRRRRKKKRGRGSYKLIYREEEMHLLLTLLSILTITTSSILSAHKIDEREFPLSSANDHRGEPGSHNDVNRKLVERAAAEEYRIQKGWRPAESRNYKDCYEQKCMPYMTVSSSNPKNTNPYIWLWLYVLLLSVGGGCFVLPTYTHTHTQFQ